MDNLLYKDYFKNHEYNEIHCNFNLYSKIYKLNFKNDGIQSGKKVLEIGSWKGNFAYFCQMKWITEYTGIELDSEMVETTKRKFPQYKIHHKDIITYLQETTEKYDIIFSSHVFEHFTIEQWIELAKLIREHLNIDGKWINIMPNAANFMAWMGRYNDITHKTIYTENSFNQILLMAWFIRNNIEHRNSIRSRLVICIRKIIFPLFRWFFLFIGAPLQKIYTFEIYSVIKKQ